MKTGYKVIHFPWDDVSHLPGNQIDLVSGWLSGNSSWGRPVDIAVDAQGGMFISDDQSGTIYRLSYAAATTDQPPVPRFTHTCTGRTCTFDARTSTDDVGITRYVWRFGDDSGAEGAVVTHTYSAAGTYRVLLKVTDTAGQVKSRVKHVTVQ